jgi:hypothetical protein
MASTISAQGLNTHDTLDLDLTEQKNKNQTNKLVEKPSKILVYFRMLFSSCPFKYEFINHQCHPNQNPHQLYHLPELLCR